MSTLRSLLSPGYEPGDGRADGAQLVDGQWWHPLFGCDSLQYVADNARQAAPLEPVMDQVAQQILQHAVEAGLSPQDWTKTFNKFFNHPNSVMTFDPNSITPSPDFVDYISNNTHRDAMKLATFWARWGATEAAKALQLPIGTGSLKSYLEKLGQGVAP